MRVVTLTENTSCREDLVPEHGLSLYIETGEYKILFDMGKTSAFADHAEKLGVDLAAVDFAVLSHGHYDHGGGLKRFLQINQKAPVYVHPLAFAEHYNGREKYIGLDPALREEPRIIRTGSGLELAPGIRLEPGAGREAPVPVDSFGLNVLRDGALIPDPFDHEQYLLIREGEKTVCFSGCSHRGVVNIAYWFRPDVLVGGFHFVKLDPQRDREYLDAAAEKLLAFGGRYLTGHCTGEGQYAYLKTRMGDALDALRTGSEFEI